MFFHLSPSRRVLLLIAVILLFSFRVGSGEDAGGDPRGGLMLSALCLLAILALEVADRVALKRDLEVARDIQNWLVPKIAPQIPGLDIPFATRPANTVAGDYYDVLLMPAAGGAASAVLFAVADVAGKEIPAGLLMASFRACLHTQTETADLSSLVARLNRFCAADSLGGRYASSRTQFGKPIASFQMVQGKLAWMATEITKSQLLNLQVGRLKERGAATPQRVSLIKGNGCRVARECTHLARESWAPTGSPTNTRPGGTSATSRR